VLSGEVGEFIDALRLAENATLLAEGARAAS
jgi:hypothetical protein